MATDPRDPMGMARTIALFRRKFMPLLDLSIPSMTCERLIEYNEEKQVFQLQMPLPYPNEKTVVMRIHGACRGSGTSSVRASYSVYLGPNSRYNMHGLLPASLPQTRTRAEMEALHHALDVIDNISHDDAKLNCIKMGADSSFLDEVICDGVEGLIANGGHNSRELQVADFDRLRKLRERLGAMESDNDGGIEVQSWSMGRDLNFPAEILASVALDSHFARLCSLRSASG